MASIGTALRRTLFLLTLAVGVGAAVSWWRSQSTTATPSGPPQWPEWPDRPEAARSSVPSVSSVSSERVEAGDGWMPAHDDGSAPQSHPIKVKVSSGIFHVPGGRFYDRTRPDRCYPTAAAAEADGYRRSKT